ncbi:hemagglutinin repeat-containing protein [Chromobacterium haemolyticum]|uniref:hemagglutinin repeat-containing protein n=1 Tax=Chromobacterium haemolyticum TaxID=394935 RepID=UPI00244A9C83|nr:hemagglutinin repeat-containing protein [Chromobacterium haemolyticum]MDH0340180.1 hemagglutinin repeat-containing protein [Chromobacterium haemolyticum]
MNRLCYRLIFNRARGLIMAVAEIVKPMGAGGGRSAASVAASRRLGVTLRGIVWASWCALAGASALAGGIVADPNAPAAQRPNVINTANGLPQVNIQAPSAAGVSRNQYSQFDVDKRGAILNNSGTSVQTQLGGWVQGNPNLNPAAPARVILNEVNSANPSQLRGFLEVAGGRAQVIVANPSGILCDGCGTINAGRMTLTTGRPELNPDGSLAGYRVESGVIRIEGAGMQAGSTEYAELMARAVEVQAGIWAPQLSVSAGRNRISADHQNIQALAADRAGRPGFAIDVAQLGGMYAGKIRLLATEAGVGVRSSGQLSGGEQLKLDSAGQLTLNGRQNGGDIQYRAAGNIEHGGASYSRGKLEVSGDAALRQSGTMAAAGDVKVSARDIVANGDFAAGSDDKGQVGTTGALSLKAGDSLQLSGHALAGSSLDLNAAAMNAADAKLRANDSVTLTAENGLGLSRANVNTGRLVVQAGGRIDSDAATLQAGQWQASAAALNNLGGVWEQIGQGSGDFRIGQLLDNRGGRIEADSLALSLGQLDNGGGKLLALSDAAQSWSVRQSLSNRGGLIGGNGSLSVNAGSLDNAGGAVQSARRLALRIDTAAGNRGGKLLAAEGLSLDAGSLDNRDGGRVDGGESLALNASGLLDNRAGLLAGSANVAVSAGALSNAKGAIESQGELRLSAQGLLDNSQGKLLSGRAQTLKAGSFANDGGSIGSRAGLTLASGAASNRGGEILSLGDGEFQLASLDNADGKLLSDGKLRVRAQGDVLNQQGVVSTLQQLELHSRDGKIDNKGGKLQAGDTLALSAQQLNNGQGGVIDGDGKLTLNSAGQLGNDGGRIRGGAAVELQAGGLSNAGGALESKATLVVKVDGALDNHGGKLLSEQAQSLQSASLNNDKGSIGSRVGLTLASGTASNRGGEILSLGDVELKLASLDNAGGKVHGDGKLELQVQGDILNRKGQLSALKQMELHSQAGKLDNQGGKLLSGGVLNAGARQLDNSQGGIINASGKLTLDSIGRLDNAGGRIGSSADIALQAGDLQNTGGVVEGEAAVSVSVDQALSNAQGKLRSKQALSLTAGSVNNDGGEIASHQSLSLQTGAASNRGGEILSLGDGELQLASLDNADGKLLSDGKLRVRAQGDVMNQQGVVSTLQQLELHSRDGKIDNAGGKLQAGDTLALSAQQLDNGQGGVIDGDGKLTLNSAGQLGNDGGRIRSGAAVAVTAGGLSNAGGALESKATLVVKADGVLNNQGGKLLSEQAQSLQAGSLNNDKGSIGSRASLKLESGDSSNRGGEILSLGDGELKLASLDNAGGKVHSNGELALRAQGDILNRKGQISALKALELHSQAGKLDNQGGKLLSGGALNTSAKLLDNSQGGVIDGDGKLTLSSAGRLDNAGGRIGSGADIALRARELENAGGVVEGEAAVSAVIDQALSNAQGKLRSKQALSLKAGSVNNNSGEITSLQGLDLQTGAASNQGGVIASLGKGEFRLDSLRNDGGKILSGGPLQLQAQRDIQNARGLIGSDQQLKLNSLNGKVDNAGGKLQAGDTLALSAQQLDNGQGGVIDGDGKLTLNSAGQMGNDGGRIRSGAAVAVTAGGLSNAGGALESKATLVVKADGVLNNQGGKLLSEQAQSLQVASLNNDKGSIGSRAGLTLASGAVSNRGGEILSLGDGELKLASLDNAGGKVHSDGKLELQAQGDILNHKGQISAQKPLELHSQAGKLDNQGGKLLSGGALNTSAKLLDNSQGGVIDGRGTLDLSASDGLDNRGGAISASAGLTAQAAKIDNAGGAMESEAALTLSASGRLNNEKGLLLSHQQQSLKAGNLNNDGGDIVSRAALKLQTGAASNQSGRITSLGDGEIQLDQLDNGAGKLQSGGALTLLSQGEINNQLGRISAQRGMRLDGGALRNQQGTLAGGEDITVRAGQMSNQNGAVASQRGLSLTLDALDNRDGKMQTLGEMTLNSVGLLNNQDGKLVANQGLQLSAGELDNQRGLISSGQAISVGAGALRNQHGKLISSGDASYQLTQLLNQDGELQSGGAAQLSLSGALDNSRGKIITDQGLQLKAAAVNNASGMLSSRGALSLSAGELGNRYGSLLSLGDIKLGLSGFDNQYGQVQTAGALEAQLSGQIDNRQGKLIADRDQRLRTSQLHNQGGAVSSGQALSLHAGQLNNQSGNMVGQTSLSLDLQQDYVFRDGDTLASQGPLSLRTSGSLRNEGKWANVGNVSLQAASFSNAAGAKLVSGGKLDINGAGQALNQGRLDAEQLSLTASALDNTGMISGRDVTVNGGVIDNHGGQAVLAATRSLSLNAGSRLSNRDSGYIYSGGALSLSSGDLIENISTTIEAEGDVSIRAGRLNNQRTHVDIKRAAESENYSWYKYNYYWDVFERVGGWDWSAVTKSLPVNDAEAAKTRYGTILQVNEAKKQALVRFQGTQERWVNYNAIKKNDSGGYDMTFYQGYSCFQGAACPYEHTVWREVWSGRNEQWNPAIHINPLELDFVDPNNKFNLRNRSASGTKTRDKLISVGEVASLSAGGNMTVNISGQLLNDASRIAANGGITINGADNGGGDARVINRAYSVNERIQETGTDHYDRNTRHWFPTYTLDKTVALQTIDATIAGHQGVSVRAPSIENITINPAQVSAAEAAKAAAQAEQAAWDGSQTTANAGQARGGQGPEAGRLGQVQSGGEALPLSLGAGERIAPSAGNNAVAAVQSGTAAQQVKMEQNPSTVGPALEGAKLAHAQAGGAPVAAQVATAQPRAQTHPLKGSPAQPGLLDRLPNNQLFQQNPSPTAPYLIETDSRFTEYSNFVSSDYMLKQLNYDPAGAHKRLGDGYYEQKLVRDQILALTGRPSLRGEDATEQFKALMNQGVNVAKDFRLTTGVALTPAQIAALQQDIVWMVSETVNTANGPQTVLVPTVYLAHNTVGLSGDGAVIAGKDLSLSAASLSNSGKLQADQSLVAKADVIRNTGGLIQADTVKLLADSLTLDTDLQNAGRQAAVSGRDVSLSGVDIALKGAKIDATELLSLSASNNLTLSTARSRKEGSVDLIAGSMGNRDATLGPDAGGSGVATVSGVWETAQGSSLQSGGKLNLSAGKDLTLTGSSAHAKGQLNVSAGNRLSVLADKTTNNTTLTADSASSRVEARYQADTLIASQLSGGAGVVAVAGQELSVQGSRVASDQGQVLLSGTQVDIGATARHVEIDDYENNHIGQTRSQRQQAIRDTQAQGSQISGQQGVTIQARKTDLTVQGSELVSDNGDLKLSAARDIRVGAAEESHSFQEQAASTRKNLANSKQSLSQTDERQTLAKGSSLSGESISLQAGQDLTVAGSSVAATHDVDLLAGRDVTVTTAENRQYQQHDESVKRSGLLGSGGIGFTIGSQKQRDQVGETSVSQTNSTVGSVLGKVNIDAGRNALIKGSDLVAGGDIDVLAQNIRVEDVANRYQRDEKHEASKSGLTVALSGVVGAAANTAVQQAQDSKKASGRLAALQGVQAGLSGYQAYQAYQQEAMKPAAEQSFVGISLSVGNQQSQSHSQRQQSQSQGSQLTAGGNLSLTATGSGAKDVQGQAQDGDISVTGGRLKAGKDLTLDAARDLQLQAGRNEDSQSGSNKSSGWNAGFSIGVGQGAGISIFANANKGRGKEEGQGSRWNETVLSAGDTLNLQSGRDTSLTGASASGKTVVADIGRNLTLQSLQDQDRYHSEQSNASAGASFTFGSMNGSASISISRQKANSDFVSVQEQTGLYAGQGGFDVKVGRHTQLDGAVIASTAKADKNTLDTGTLGFSNQHNQADFKVESQSFGISSGGNITDSLKGTLMSQGASSVLGGGNSSGHAESTTYAAVSEGAIKVRDQDKQKQDLKDLSRDAEHAANGLSPIFDKEKELNRLQEAQLIGQIGAQATQIVATEMMMEENEKVRRNPEYAKSEKYKALQDKWGANSDFQRAAQAATAALQGLAGGNVQAAISGAAAPYLAGVVKKMTDGNKEANVMAHALLGAALAQMKGESAAAGAAGGATAPVVAELLLTQLYPGKKVEDLNESQKQTISALTTMAGSLAGSLAGGDSAGALTGAQTAKNEVENNFLKPAQIKQKADELAQAKTLERKAEVEARFDKIDQQQRRELVAELIGNELGVMTPIRAEQIRDALKNMLSDSSCIGQCRQDVRTSINELDVQLSNYKNQQSWNRNEQPKLDLADAVIGSISLASPYVIKKLAGLGAGARDIKAISDLEKIEDIKRSQNFYRDGLPYDIRRIAYESEAESLAFQANKMLRQGVSEEVVAKWAHAQRNKLKVDFRDISPKDFVIQAEKRNVERYGNPLGPTIEQLREKGKSWRQIIESAARPGGGDFGFGTKK